MHKKIFYQPKNAWVGDVIPYAENDTFYLYYLKDSRLNGATTDETPWDLLTTENFLDFVEEGTAIPIGTREEADNCCYTGCCIKEAEGKYHIFYTTHNNHSDQFKVDGKSFQLVAHATSSDLRHWTKHPELQFGADKARYEVWDWRDPFVFYNEEEKRWNMLLAARKAGGSFRRGGCIVTCYSDDLNQWTVGDPFYDPEMYLTHECPDVFKMGDWWYLVYSTFTDRFVTHYRMSKHITGPWIAPAVDTFDARANYAIKTAATQKGRFAFGWIPTKEGESDYAPYMWAGTMVVHQLVQAPDGTLFTKMPEDIYQAFGAPVPLHPLDTFGAVITHDGGYTIDGTEKQCYVVFDDLPEQCMIEATFTLQQTPRWFGITLHADDAYDGGYYYRFEPFYNRLVMDMWPRKELAGMQHALGGDIPHQVELERQVDFSGGKVRIKMLVEGEIVVLYVNDQVALSTRLYNLLPNKKWTFSAYDGIVKLEDITIKKLG